tara:strand:- start:144 stop:815 length:672 start_codon:yes stop_codon:yes gene_type:complete
MSFFFNLKSTTTKCINGCVLFNDTSNFSYWENKKTTSDEEHIVEYLKTNNLVSGKNIMHIGVGNSYFVKNISNYNKVDAITLSKKEMDYGLSFNIRNYNIFFQNKYSYKNLLNETLKSYDIIVDVNLKSFACCEEAFYDLFLRYVSMLNPGGIIITGREGMNWSRLIKPVLSFSFRNFFFKRLKEFDGPINNCLSEKECTKISDLFNLSIDTNNPNLVLFKKS